MHSKNLTLLTDLYELTMMQGYYDKQDNPTVIFDVFYRSNPFSSGYAIAAGLEQVIEYVKNLNFSYDDVDYLRSLHIFSEDFLQYLSGHHFTGSIYAIRASPCPGTGCRIIRRTCCRDRRLRGNLLRTYRQAF